jgi:Bacterial sugar transferase
MRCGGLPTRHVSASGFLKQAGESGCGRTGTSAEGGAAVTPGLPERCRVPVRSAVLPLGYGFAAVAAGLITLRPRGPRWSGRVTKRALDLIIGAALLMAGTPDAEWTVSHECTRVSRLLPQLLNVIRGQMSLVAPRPERPYFTLRES